jgi:hypothetical protein
MENDNINKRGETHVLLIIIIKSTMIKIDNDYDSDNDNNKAITKRKTNANLGPETRFNPP